MNAAELKVKKFTDGQWAWNTLREKFIGEVADGSNWYPDAEEKALADLMTFTVYKHFFKGTYNKIFMRQHIPPQCWYLFPPPKRLTDEERMQRQRHKHGQHETNGARHRRLIREQNERMCRSTSTEQFHDETQFNEPKKGNIMLDIRNVTIINGDNADTFDNDQIFGMIATIEGAIEKLEKTKNKPKALTTKIIKLQKTIKKLVEISDAREPAEAS